MNRWLCVKLIQSAGCLKVKQMWLARKNRGQVLPAALPTWCCTLFPPMQGSLGHRGHPCAMPPAVPRGPAAGWHVGAEPPLLYCQCSGSSCSTAGHAADCSTMLEWDALTFEHHAYLLSLMWMSHLLPLWLRSPSLWAGSITFLMLIFTWQLYRGLKLGKLIWRQGLVPRSQVYGRAAFPWKKNQWAQMYHSPSDTGSLFATNSSQLACFHQGKKELYRLKQNSAHIGQIYAQDVDNHPDHLSIPLTNTAISTEVYSCAQMILYIGHNQI